jgi:hypothetical protein
MRFSFVEGRGMSGRLLVTLAIIAGIGVGTGALVFGVLMLTLDSYVSEEAGIAAAGAGLLAASAAALVAQLAGGFRQLDERDDRDF